MRAVIQRVKSAAVTVVDEETTQKRLVGEIDAGLCVLLGVTHEDTAVEVEKTVRKIAELKLMRAADGADGAADRLALEETDLPILLVSQFTLYADVRKGRKPSWSKAAPGEVAEPLFNQVVTQLRERGIRVETGEFGANMEVALVNDGPFTILFEA